MEQFNADQCILIATPSCFLATLESTSKDFDGAPFQIENTTITKTSRSFGRIVAANPAPLVGYLVGGTHNVHGVMETANPAIALPNRRHISVTLSGYIDPDQDPEGPEMQAITTWIHKFVREVKSAGISLEAGYVSFDRSNINLERFYGKEDSERLLKLKRAYDPENLFSLAYPNLAGRESVDGTN